MSYLHCPACSRAYNLATQPSCPYCPAVAAPVPVAPAEDIVAAVEALARLLARATPAERAAATASMERLALPATATPPAEYHDTMRPPIRTALAPAPAPPPSIRTALAPTPPRHTAKRKLLATLAVAVLDRLAPHAPRRLFRVVARVKALAA